MTVPLLLLCILFSAVGSLAFVTPSLPPKAKFSPSLTFLSLGKRIDNDTNDSPSSTTRVIRFFLDQMPSSEFIAEKHAEHCESNTVTHLFKGTPLVNLPDKYKLQFVDSWAGKALATVMAEEQGHLGAWKIQKILEAGGDYDEKTVRQEMNELVADNQIVMYSFVDCPWCIAAKDLLNEHYSQEFSISVIELEELGLKGKAMRAELAKWTGRTSLPAIFVRGQPIGGFTDGVPCGEGLKPLYDSGALSEMLSE